MNRSHHPPTQPRNGHNKVSQRGLLSIVMLFVSIGALTIAVLGGVKMIADVLRNQPAAPGALAQIIVIGLAYFVGWLTAMVAIRVYGNLILPILIRWFIWGFLAASCYLYIAILQRMYNQPDDLSRFFKYMLVMAGVLSGMVGLHLIIEDHDLRPFAVPLLIISVLQLGLIVYRYVYDTSDVKPGFLWEDLVFFFAMASFSISMLRHWGLLEPIRRQITNYFDLNSASIRTED